MPLELKSTIAPNPTTIRGQTCQLNASPDGTKLVYGAGQSVIIRDIEDPNKSRVFAEHGKRCTVARYSHTGQWIASADEAGKLKIWNPVQDDELVHTIKYDYHLLAGEIKDIAWDGESKRIVVAGDGQSVCANAIMYDTGSKVGDFLGVSKRLNSCDMRPCRPFKAVLGGDDFASIFYAGPPFKFVKTNRDHDMYVQCVRFSPDGALYASASSNGKIVLYDGKEAEQTNVLDGKHSGGCYAVSWNKESSHLVSASADKTVKLWDVAANTEVSTTSIGTEIADQQLGIVWTSQDQVISVSYDGTLNYIDPRQKSVARRVYGHTHSIRSVNVCQDGTMKTGSGFDGNSYSWDDSLTSTYMPDGHTAEVLRFHDHEDGFMSIGGDNKIRTGDAGYSGATLDLPGRPECSASSRGTTVVGCSGEICLIRGNEIIDSIQSEPGLKAIAINKFGNVVASGQDSNSVRTFDVSSGNFKEGDKLEVNGGANAMEFSHSGELLAIGDNQDKAIRLLDVNNNYKVKNSIFPHSSKVTAITWSPDDKYLASSDLSQAICVWNTSAGKRKSVIKHAHRCAFVNDMSWLDDNTLVSAGHDGNLKIWDASF